MKKLCKQIQHCAYHPDLVAIDSLSNLKKLKCYTSLNSPSSEEKIVFRIFSWKTNKSCDIKETLRPEQYPGCLVSRRDKIP